MVMPIDPGTRVAQSDGAIDAFEKELTEWFAAIAAKDSLKKYDTQLNDLKQLLDEGNTRLRQAARDVPEDLPYGDTCRRCREIDKGLVLARMVSHYFRSKYDQRDDKKLAPVLAAADEVSWSSFSLPFRMLDRKSRRLPCPTSRRSICRRPFLEWILLRNSVTRRAHDEMAAEAADSRGLAACFLR